MLLTRRALNRGILGAGLLGVSGRSASAETTLERIKKAGELVVATEGQYPPFEFVRDGKLVGLGRDLLEEVTGKLGVKLKQLDLPFQGILPGLIAKKFDLVATSLGLTEERARRYAFTMPTGISQAHVLKRKGNAAISSLADLNGKVVATQLASSVEPTAKALDEKLKAEGGKGFAELKLFPAFSDTFLAVGSGVVDAAIANLPLMLLLMRDRPGVFEIVGPATERKTYLAWATRPEDAELRDFVNGVFRELRASGKMGELQEKWLGIKLDLPDTGYLPAGAR